MDGWWAASYVALWALVVLLCVVVVALARQVGALYLRLGPRGALEVDAEGPPLGEAPPAATVTDLRGNEVAVGGPGEAQLLLFVSPGCHICEQVLPAVSVVSAAGRLRPVVLTDADDHETARAYAGKRVSSPVAAAPMLARDYGVPGTPYVVVLDELGVVRAKGTINNLEQMEGLVDTASRRLREAAEERRAS